MKRAIFIHVPKTAGKSITRALKLKRFVGIREAKKFNNELQVTFLHQLYPTLIDKGIISNEVSNESFKFCFCRNPFDRAVSHWKYTMRRHPNRLMPGTSFLDFTRLLGSRRDWVPQVTWTNGVDLNFIGRFENLENDILKVANLIGTQVDNIPKMNTTKHNHYSHYLCEESISNIVNYYKYDFNFFNYSTTP